jgi:hypothetical protein
MERYSSIDASTDQYQRSSAAWSASRENGTAKALAALVREFIWKARRAD